MTLPSISQSDLVHTICGLVMGAADIIPGVSGGTMALILGVYERLVRAISQFDGTLLRMIVRGRWRTAADHADLRFLMALGFGIAVGIVSLASLMHYLLQHYRSYTMAGFFGLILGSSVLVARMIRTESAVHRGTCFGIGMLGTVLAMWIVTRHAAGVHDGYAYIFLCGMVAICAMILPGISGAYILLLLGKYEEITGIVKKLPRMELTAGELGTMTVFAMGCAVGLLLFSKLLRVLLARWHAPTMAILCGFMLGSLYRIWPFQHELTPAIENLRHQQYEPFLPTTITAEVVTCTLIALAAMAGVLLLDRVAKKSVATHSIQ